MLLLFVTSTAVDDFKAAVPPVAQGWRMLEDAGVLTEKNGGALFAFLPRAGAEAEAVNAKAIVDAATAFLAKRAGHYLQTQPAFDMAEGLASAPAATVPATASADDDPVIDGAWRFTGETALVVTTLKPQKDAAFLALLEKVRTALQKSPRAARREQARHWQVRKVTPASQGGAPVYISLMDPVVRDTNYAWSAILADAFEGPDLIRAYSDYGDIVASVSLFDLTTLEP